MDHEEEEEEEEEKEEEEGNIWCEMKPKTSCDLINQQLF